jgi:hydrogenase 3 maturation protease
MRLGCLLISRDNMKKIVISIGNPLKSDDNIGNLLLNRLKETIRNKNIDFIEGSTNPENFIEPLKKINPDVIFILDVALFSGNAGDVKLFQLQEILKYNISTHNLPITVFQKFFPKTKIILIGIKPKSLDFGEDLTPELKDKFVNIFEEVKRIIETT